MLRLPLHGASPELIVIAVRVGDERPIGEKVTALEIVGHRDTSSPTVLDIYTTPGDPSAN
jgi:hypothetical protein